MRKYIKTIATLIVLMIPKIIKIYFGMMLLLVIIVFLFNPTIIGFFSAMFGSRYLLTPEIRKEMITESIKLSNGDIVEYRIMIEKKKVYSPRDEPFPTWNEVYYIYNNRTEISWDTGFDGIGRVSIQFTPGDKLKIDRIDNIWYVVGAVSDKYHITNKSCIATGVVYSGNCILAIDKNGFVRKDLYNKLHIDKIMAKKWVLSY